MRARLDYWLTRVMGRHFPFPTLTQEQEGKEEGEEGEEEKEDEEEQEGEGAEVLDRLEGSTGYFQLREVGGGMGQNIWSCHEYVPRWHLHFG